MSTMVTRRAPVLGAGVAVALVLAACGSEAEGSKGDVIKFGFLNGITGDYSAYYEGQVVGAEIAIEEINAAGGVLGRDVELVTADNLSTVEGAVQGFSRLVDVEGVVGIGGVESDGGLAIFEAAHEQEIPVFCPLCGTSELDERGGKFIFRLTGSDTDGGLVAAQFARDAGYEDVSMLVQNTEGAAGPAEVFRKVHEEIIGGKIPDDIRFNPGASSYQSEVDQAFQADPDAVYIAAGSEAGIVILREWERRGAQGRFFTSPDLVVPEVAGLSPALEDGVIAGAMTTYDTTSLTYERYAAVLKGRTGATPSPGLGDAIAYDQYIALALAITLAGTTDGAKVAPAIMDVLNPGGTDVYSYEEGLAELKAGNDINYHGASTSLDLNKFGNLASPVFAEQHIINGEWREVRIIELDPELRAELVN
jgi:branched-chain amino acid transport system substrate-binding protein